MKMRFFRSKMRFCGFVAVSTLAVSTVSTAAVCVTCANTANPVPTVAVCQPWLCQLCRLCHLWLCVNSDCGCVICGCANCADYGCVNCANCDRVCVSTLAVAVPTADVSPVPTLSTVPPCANTTHDCHPPCCVSTLTVAVCQL
jgi:hypothetical protein